jgi:FkbM family methyltransferase
MTQEFQPVRINPYWVAPEGDKKISRHLDQPRVDLKYEKKFRDFLVTHMPNKRVMIDVGANVGIWCRPLAKHFESIHAYEPSPKNIQCLKINCKENRNIKFIQKGLSNFNDNVLFYDAVKNCGNTKIYRKIDKVRSGDFYCDVVTLDSTNTKKVDLIKIDTQGFELDVLQGCTETIKHCKPWIVHEVNRDIDDVVAFIESFNIYEMIYIKSKRAFIWAPKEGSNKPADKSIFGRWFGPGPYTRLFPPLR